MAAQDELALDASLRLAGDQTPQIVAPAMEAEATLGIPRDVAERNPQQVQAIQQRRAQVPARQILTESPLLAEFMMDPGNATLAQADVPTLMDLERRIQSSDINTFANTMRLVGNRTNQLTGNLLQAVASVTDVFKHVEDAIRYPYGEGKEADVNRMGALSRGLRQVGTAVEEGEAFDYIPEFTFDRMLAEPTPSNIAGLLFEQGVGSVPDMLAAMYALPAYVTSLSQEIAAERAANNGGAEVDIGDIVSVLPLSVAISYMDRFSTRGMLGALEESVDPAAFKQVTAEIAKASGREAGTEFIQESAQYAGETAGTDAGFDLGEMFARGAQGAFVGAGVGGAVRGVTASMQAVAQRQSRDTTTELTSRFEQADLDAQLSAIQNNTFRQTSVPRFQDFLSGISGGQALYLAPEVLQAAETAGVNVPFLQGRAAEQADLEITYSDIASVIDDKDTMAVLRPYLKRSPSQLSQTELKEATSNREAVEALVKTATEDTLVRSEADAIHDSIRAQIVATGRQSDVTARYSAELIPAYVTTKVAELRARGIDTSVNDVYDALGLRVEKMTTPADGSLQQAAYHGSKHRFDRFSLEAIGTGEGSQAFGWGLYFAGDKSVAEYYREMTGGGVKTFVGDLEYNQLDDAQKYAASYIAANNISVDKFIEDMQADLSRPNPLMPREEVEAAIAAAETLRGKTIERRKAGSVYQVDIPENDTLLDLDRMVSEQPEPVKAAMETIKETLDQAGVLEDYLDRLNAEWEELTGREVYMVLKRAGVDDALPPLPEEYERSLREDERASKYLLTLGVLGSRFLDGKSRGKGDGTHNYVIWDDSRVTVDAVDDQLRQAAAYAQQTDATVLGDTLVFDDALAIRLGNASDLSTFLHEAGHVFLEAERRFAAKYGVTPQQEALLEMLGVASFNDIQTPQHELFARTFEDYLRTGKAPSLRLRDAFAAFSRWLTRIYQGILRLGKELDPETVDVFNRLLATQVEMDEAAASPEYQQYFRDQKQAGMTDQQWKKYTDLQQRRRDRSQMNLQDKLLDQMRRMYTEVWKEERDMLYDEELTRMQGMPVHAVVEAMRNDDVRLDAAAVKQILGVEFIPPGRLLTYSRVKDGVDPEVLAEQYGYDSPRQMLDEIQNYEKLTKGAAREAADARMLEKYGDILNDGTIEAEAREAFQNDVHAELLIEEIAALRRQSRAPRKPPDVDREELKARAKQAVSKMQASTLRADRFYRAEIRAAKAAGAAKTPEAAHQAKVQQLVNHYLYREALEAQRAYTKARAYVTRVRTRKYSTWEVSPVFIQQMKMLSRMYDTAKAPMRLVQLTKLVEWYEGQLPSNPDLTLLDPSLVRALAERELQRKSGLPLSSSFTPPRFSELTVDEVAGVYEQLRHLRYVGGKASSANQEATRAERAAGIASIEENGGRDIPDPDGPGRFDKIRDELWHLVNLLPSLRNLTRKLDGFKDGWAYENIWARAADSHDTKLRLTREIHDAYATEMSEVADLGLGRGKAHSITQVKEDGTTWTLDEEHRFVLALYWGHEYAREAVRKGHRVTDADVIAMLATLTEAQAKLVNAVWKINESQWPALSAAGTRRYGVAPARTTPLPFTAGGHQFTGGHLRLFYVRDTVKTELLDGETFTTTGMAPGKAGSLHDLTSSGGRKVSLDKQNIFRAIDDNVHFIAYSDAGVAIQRVLGNREVQAAIIRKHGRGFLQALNESVQGILTNRQSRDMNDALARVLRVLRKARTFGFLAYSVRNTVQQISALPIIVRDIGSRTYAAHVAKFYTPGMVMRNKQFVTERSQFMKNRSALVNREAAEYLNTTIVSGKGAQMWETFKRHGFTPQTMVDMLLAFPAWMAKYEMELGEHGDEKRAARNADTLVSETVGSGADLHLGVAYRSNQSQFMRTITAFGSWFNSYYNRMYRATKGGTDWANWETLDAMFTTPMMVSVLAATLVADGPNEDDSALEWAAKKYGEFMLGTVFILRDAVAAMKGFTPSNGFTPLAEFPAAVVQATNQIQNDTEGAAGDAAAVIRAGTSVVPVPGSGNITRVLDYVESFEQGNEGTIDDAGDMAREGYQALVEGPDRNQ